MGFFVSFAFFAAAFLAFLCASLFSWQVVQPGMKSSVLPVSSLAGGLATASILVKVGSILIEPVTPTLFHAGSRSRKFWAEAMSSVLATNLNLQ